MMAWPLQAFSINSDSLHTSPTFRQLRLHSKPSHCTPCHTLLVSLDLCLATPVLLPLLHFAVLSPAGQAACGVVLGHHAAMLQERNLWRLKHSLAYC